MNEPILKIIETFSAISISEDRQQVLRPLANYIQAEKDKGATIRLNFICTHNSRRSHLAQIWAQTAAYYFGVKNVYCYSGGTEATALFPKVVETLLNQGFQVQKLSESENAIYAVKYAPNEAPIICFSKTYSDQFNPKNNFGAVMTCNNADENCPLVFGAAARLPIKYDDPKMLDGTHLQAQKYAERSLAIAQEMWWVFKGIK
jgi:arsenate reductase